MNGHRYGRRWIVGCPSGPFCLWLGWTDNKVSPSGSLFPFEGEDTSERNKAREGTDEPLFRFSFKFLLALTRLSLSLVSLSLGHASQPSRVPSTHSVWRSPIWLEIDPSLTLPSSFTLVILFTLFLSI